MMCLLQQRLLAGAWRHSTQASFSGQVAAPASIPMWWPVSGLIDLLTLRVGWSSSLSAAPVSGLISDGCWGQAGRWLSDLAGWPPSALTLASFFGHQLNTPLPDSQTLLELKPNVRFVQLPMQPCTYLLVHANTPFHFSTMANICAAVSSIK